MIIGTGIDIVNVKRFSSWKNNTKLFILIRLNGKIATYLIPRKGQFLRFFTILQRITAT